jgi:hypothetical protein
MNKSGNCLSKMLGQKEDHSNYCEKLTFFTLPETTKPVGPGVLLQNHNLKQTETTFILRKSFIKFTVGKSEK